MKSLNHAIGLWVVCCSPGAFRTEESHKFFPELGFKLASTVCDNCGGHTETSDPSPEESLSYGFSSDVGNGNSFRPASETVYTCEEVREAL